MSSMSQYNKVKELGKGTSGTAMLAIRKADKKKVRNPTPHHLTHPHPHPHTPHTLHISIHLGR